MRAQNSSQRSQCERPTVEPPRACGAGSGSIRATELVLAGEGGGVLGPLASEFLTFVDGKYANLPKDILAKKELTAEIKTVLNKAIGEFNEIFQPSATAKTA